MRIFGFLLTACLIAVPAQARDYGQQGALFPITEPDLLEQIQRKLMALQASGATAKLNEDLKRRTIAKVNRPTPVSGLGVASAMRSWAFDPTISVAEEISDDKGRVIMAAGTRVNPLDTVPLRQTLVFLDGDDPAQLDWATKKFQASSAKLILVGGAPLQLAVAIGVATTDARLSRGTSSVHVQRNAATPDFTRIDLTAVPLAWTQALLAKAWPAAHLNAGRLSGRLDRCRAHAPVRRDAVLPCHLGGLADCRCRSGAVP